MLLMSKSMQELPDSILEDDADLSVIREEYISADQVTQQQEYFMPDLQQCSENYQPLSGSQSLHYVNESLDIHGNLVYQQYHGTNSQRINSIQNNFNDEPINSSYSIDIQQNRQHLNFMQKQHQLFQPKQLQRSLHSNMTSFSESYPQSMSITNFQQIRNQYGQEDYNVDQNIHLNNSLRTSSSNNYVPFYSNNQKYSSHQLFDYGDYSSQDNSQQQQFNSNQSYSDSIFRQNANCLPLVGSTCTVVTTSPTPDDNEVDIYNFASIDDNIVNLPITYNSKVSSSEPSTSGAPVLKLQRHVALNTGLEEEDDEDDCEPITKNPIISVIAQTNSIDANKTSSNQESVNAPIKKSRKQQLPSNSKESSIITVKAISQKKVKEKSHKSKKDEYDRPLLADKEASTNAQAQTIKRISTMEGWKRMNEWLKTADRAKNVSKLKSLLNQCLEANVTVELLLSNDTPKFIRQLSKSSNDKEIVDISSKVMSKWKKLIKTGDLTTKTISNPTKKISTNISNKLSPISNTNTTNESPEIIQFTTTVSTNSSTTTKMRPKTARAKISKPRSTGLEGDDESVSYAPLVKRRVLGQPQSSTKVVNNSILGDILAASNVPPKIQISKRSVMLSDSFMDALEEQAPKKPKIVRKKINNLTGQTCSSSGLTESKGLYSDTLKNLNSRKENFDNSSNDNLSNSAEIHLTDNRRIRFADEKGLQLVNIKYFEIEEGERVNVTKMSSEDMKHFEMTRERNFIREQKGFHLSSSLSMSKSFGNFRQSGFSTTNKPWRLIPVDNVIELIEHGANSESKLIEIKRWNTVMEAFYDAYTSLQISEIDECDYPRGSGDYAPKIIPLEIQTSSPLVELNNDTNINFCSLTNSNLLSNSIIGQLPLPFSSTTLPINYSQLANQLPSSVTSLVLNLPNTITSTDDLIKTTPNNLSSLPASNFKSESDNTVDSNHFESPESPPSNLILSKDAHSKDENNSIKSLENVDGPQSPDDIDIRSLEANSTEEDLEDTDIRCIPSEQQSLSYQSNDDLDIRFNFPSTNNDLSPKPSETSIVDVNDVQALMSSLKKSGIMDSNNLAGILNKVQNIKAFEKLALNSPENNTDAVDKTLKDKQFTVNTTSTLTTTSFFNSTQSHGVNPSGDFSTNVLNNASTSEFYGFPQNVNRFSHSSGSYSSYFPPPPTTRFVRLPTSTSNTFGPSNVTNTRPIFYPPVPPTNSASSMQHHHSHQFTTQPLISVEPVLNTSNLQFNDNDILLTKSIPLILPSHTPISTTAAFINNDVTTTLNTSMSDDFASKGNALEKIKSSNFSNNSNFALSLLSNIAPISTIKQQESLPSLDQQQIESLTDAELMPWAKAFVKQCSYYQNGSCHFGDSCRFAHGSEITLGIRQVISSMRNGRGGYRGGRGRGAGTLSSIGGRTSINVVGGGVEISYEEKPIRGARRFTSPIRRNSGHTTRTRRYRRSRSSSGSISPIRTKRHSRSRSPRLRKQSDRKRRLSPSSNQRSRRSRSSSNSSIASNLASKDDKRVQNNESNTVDSTKKELNQENNLNEESKKRLFSPLRRHRSSPSKHQSYHSHHSRSPAYRHRSRSSSSSLSERKRRRHESKRIRHCSKNYSSDEIENTNEFKKRRIIGRRDDDKKNNGQFENFKSHQEDMTISNENYDLKHSKDESLFENELNEHLSIQKEIVDYEKNEDSNFLNVDNNYSQKNVVEFSKTENNKEEKDFEIEP